MSIKVTEDNFARAETSFQFQRIIKGAGGINKFLHNQVVTPIDKQNVIRMNRDTLYSMSVCDVRKPLTVTMPDRNQSKETRYMTIMVVNEDHYIVKVVDWATAEGSFQLTEEECDSPYVLVAVRVFVDPSDPEDMKKANEIKNQIQLKATSEVPYQAPDYDEASYQTIHKMLLEEVTTVKESKKMFGTKDQVDKRDHLMGAASGWGGLPANQATYITKMTPLSAGDYELVVPADVPVSAFWSVSVYNKDGFYEKNQYDAYSINRVTAKKNEDGTVTINFGTEKGDKHNFICVTEGWNYIVRLYQPGESILNGTWEFPAPKPV